MRYLPNNWKTVTAKIRRNRHVMLALDYDGTIVSAGKEPSRVLLGKPARDAIQKIAFNPSFTVVVISGRSLADITKKINIKNIYYFGNYGLEIKSPRITFNLPEAKKYKLLMLLVREDLEKKMRRIKGVSVENKQFSFSVHYRQAQKRSVKKIKEIFYSAIEPLVKEKKVEIYTAKQALVVQPLIKVDKGRVFSWLVKNFSVMCHNPLSVYIGDDITDESAFRAVNKKDGISVFVGERKTKSNARYYLKSPKEVIAFLVKLQNIPALRR